MYRIKNLLILLLMLTLIGCNNNQPTTVSTEVPSVILPPNGDTPLEEISPDIELPQVDTPTIELPTVEIPIVELTPISTSYYPLLMTIPTPPPVDS